jgi:hypothetical protein
MIAKTEEEFKILKKTRRIQTLPMLPNTAMMAKTTESKSLTRFKIRCPAYALKSDNGKPKTLNPGSSYFYHKRNFSKSKIQS